ncbi:hypothetical protein BM1_08493 [Bipolaris maydis]|nr:hypothetical protein BM1_08493 [Bipolaris maydis]
MAVRESSAVAWVGGWTDGWRCRSSGSAQKEAHKQAAADWPGTRAPFPSPSRPSRLPRSHHIVSCYCHGRGLRRSAAAVLVVLVVSSAELMQDSPIWAVTAQAMNALSDEFRGGP